MHFQRLDVRSVCQIVVAEMQSSYPRLSTSAVSYYPVVSAIRPLDVF